VLAGVFKVAGSQDIKPEEVSGTLMLDVTTKVLGS